MKRFLVILLCMMLVISTIPAVATEDTGADTTTNVVENTTTDTVEDTATNVEVLLGDVVTDGVLTNEDALELRGYIAGYASIVKSFDEDKLVLADVNQDGKITSADLNELTKLIPDYTPLERKVGQIIILKADDLSTASVATFTKMYNILKEEGITEVSMGIIGNRCAAENNDAFWTTVKGYVEDGAEIWHHGWEHKIGGDTGSEFSGAYDYDTMKENVALTLDLVEKNTGYKITTIGAPGNKVSAEFAKMLNYEFPKIDKIFFSKGKNFNAFKLDSDIYPESGSNGVTYEHFLEVYDPDAKYSVIQFHPNRLKAYDLWDDFRLMIQHLKDDGCIFMTPSQYAAYAKRVI